jgi:outer membrane protein insertion porin family
MTSRLPGTLLFFLSLFFLICSVSATAFAGDEGKKNAGKKGEATEIIESASDSEAEKQKEKEEEWGALEKISYPTYTLEKILIEGNTKTTDSTILFFIPIKKGQSFSPDSLELIKSRARLLATGWFSDVVFTLEKGSKKGNALLRIKVEERSTLLISNLILGVSEITPYGGLEITEHNFLGRGLSLSGSFVVGNPYRGFKAEFADPSIFNSPFSVGVAFYYTSGIDYLGTDDVIAIYADSEEATYRPARIDYKRIGGSVKGAVTLFKALTLTLKYRFEYIDALLPIAAVSTRGGVTETLDFGLISGISYVSALSVFLTYDTRNDPFLPSEGIYLNFGIELSNKLLGSTYNYSKYTLVLEWFKKLPWNHVIRLGFIGGLITGDAPLFEKFYIGDLSDFIPDRVLGMAFDKRKSFNLLRTSINAMRYETIAAKLFAEYIIPLYRKKKAIYGIDFFFSLGIFMLASPEDFSVAPEGYEDVSPAPIDLTANMGFRLDTSAGYFDISVGTLLNLIPIEEELTLWR